MSSTAQSTTSFDFETPLDGGSSARQPTGKLSKRAKMLAIVGLFGVSFVVGFYALGPIAQHAMGDSEAMNHGSRIGKFAHFGLLKPVAKPLANTQLGHQLDTAKPVAGMTPDARVSNHQMRAPVMVSDATVSEEMKVEELRTKMQRLREEMGAEQMEMEELTKKLEYMEAHTDKPKGQPKASLIQAIMSMVLWVTAGCFAKGVYKLVAKPAPARARTPAVAMSASQPLRRYPVNQSRCSAPIIPAVMSVAPQDQKEGNVARSSSAEMTATRDSNDSVVKEPEVDIYRDTILRYAGYLNEVGEAFRPLVAVQVVYLSYALALTYVSADALSKGGQTASLPMNQGLKGCGVAAIIDTLVFQLLASVIFPSTVINRGVALTIYLEEQFDATSKLQGAFGAASPDQLLVSLGGVGITPASIVETFPTFIGLALIPIIAPPIDGLVEKILDDIVRPWLDTTFEDCTLPFCDREECEF